MATFSNSGDGSVFDEECLKCVVGGFCPIRHVQMTYYYKACNNEIARAILDTLVKNDYTEGGVHHEGGCQMKPLLENLHGKAS